jgi:hypothetical protein
LVRQRRFLLELLGRVERVERACCLVGVGLPLVCDVALPAWDFDACDFDGVTRLLTTDR